MKQAVKEGFQLAGLGFGSIALLGTTIALLSGIGFGLYAFLQPRYVAVQYQTFKQSQSYNEGMAQQLAMYRVEYAAANRAQRDAIRSTVQDQYASYDGSQLTPELRDFLDQMKGN